MGRMIGPSLVGVFGVLILITLGVWQVQRMGWKEAKLAQITAMLVDAPVALPAQVSAEADRYRGVTLKGAYTGEVAKHPRFVVTDIERQMAARTTADTLRGLKPLLGRAHFVWIMGADSFASLHRWHDWLEIPDTLPLAVLARPGFSLRALGGPAATRFSEAQIPTNLAPKLVTATPPAWCFIPMPLRPESSTAIRRRAKAQAV